MAVRKTIQRISIIHVETMGHYFAREMFDLAEPIPDFVTRFPDKLESCLNTPFQKFAGKSLYAGLAGKGAVLFYLLVKNHPFQNGNKRIAVMTLIYFLSKNGRWLQVSNDKLYEFAREVAISDPRDRASVMKKIRSFIRGNIDMIS